MSEIELQDLVLRNALQILRLSAGEQAAMDEIMRQLERELRDLLASSGVSGDQRRALKKLLADAQAVIDPAYAQAAKSVDTHALALVVAEHTVDLLGDLGSIAMPSRETLASLTEDVMIDGAPSSAWWARQAEDTRFKFAQQVQQGVINGETNERIVQRIVGRRGEPGIMDLTRRNARALVQSSVMSAANEARLATFRKNNRMFTGVRWLSTLDHHSCKFCAALDGQAWNLDGEKLPGAKVDFTAPPAHFSCFPGDTLVSTRGRITGASKRWFDGEVVVIRTASDRELTCTPNHPILTDRGWIAAGLLDVGGNVVRHLGSDREAFGRGDGEDVPTRIEDVAEAFLASELVRAVPMPVAAKDFHGDGEGSDVAIIGTDRLLADEVYSLCAEHGRETGFMGRGLTGLVPLASGGHFADRLEARLPAGVDAADSLGSPGPLLGGHIGPFEPLGLGLPAPLNAVLAQDASDHEAGETELLGNGILGHAADIGSADGFLINDGARPGWYVAMLQFAQDDGVRNPGLAADLSSIEAGEIELDTVVECRRVGFSHWVYNLETESGWYIADGLVAHNCRCVLSPVPKTDALEAAFPGIGAKFAAVSQRASANGPVHGSTTFNDFLKRQSPEFVERTLGKQRAALFREGKITVRDLVSGTGRELTLAELMK